VSFEVSNANNSLFAVQPAIGASGTLTFTPAANANGSAMVSVILHDNGGTDFGGADSTVTTSFTLTVTAVNDAPTGANNTVTTLEDQNYTFAVVDFGYNDPNDSPANALQAVQITTLPLAGTLKNNSVGVTAGQLITVADITGGKLKFCPAANANGLAYASFTFQVQDDGGIANGGVDLDQSANTMTVNVTSVNDAPSFTSGGDVTVNEDSGAYSATWA